MKIGIIDADLLGRDKHHFPNLACEKISGYWKAQGAEVKLLMDYTGFENYDHVYVSKVFTDTPVPIELKESEKLHIGGTGFYFDKASNLPDEIEHHMPEYRLYDEWIENDVKKAEELAKKKNKEFNRGNYIKKYREYTDYAIGFMKQVTIKMSLWLFMCLWRSASRSRCTLTMIFSMVLSVGTMREIIIVPDCR